MAAALHLVVNASEPAPSRRKERVRVTRLPAAPGRAAECAAPTSWADELVALRDWAVDR
jgi:hypothetical protein